MNRRVFITGALGVLATPMQASPQQHDVEIAGFKFVPAHLTVQPGDTVRFTNRDIAPHTATAIDQSWNTGDLGPGQSATITVTENWQRDYFCEFHPVMTGQIKTSAYSGSPY